MIDLICNLSAETTTYFEIEQLILYEISRNAHMIKLESFEKLLELSLNKSAPLEKASYIWLSTTLNQNIEQVIKNLGLHTSETSNDTDHKLEAVKAKSFMNVLKFLSQENSLKGKELLQIFIPFFIKYSSYYSDRIFVELFNILGRFGARSHSLSFALSKRISSILIEMKKLSEAPSAIKGKTEEITKENKSYNKKSKEDIKTIIRKEFHTLLELCHNFTKMSFEAESNQLIDKTLIAEMSKTVELVVILRIILGLPNRRKEKRSS